MSENLTFLHHIVQKSYDGKSWTVHEEAVKIDQRGVIVKYYHKDDKKKDKIVIYQKDDKYVIEMTSGDKKDTREVEQGKIEDEVKKIKPLEFAQKYFKKKYLEDANKDNSEKPKTKKASKKTSKK